MGWIVALQFFVIKKRNLDKTEQRLFPVLPA